MIDLVRLVSFVLQIEVSFCDRLLHYRVRQRERADEEAAAKRLLRPQITLGQPSFSLPDYLGPPTATLQPTLTV